MSRLQRDIGELPDGLGDDMDRFLRQLRQAVQELRGSRGDQSRAALLNGAGSSGGAGGSSGGEVTTPPDLTPPPSPSGVAVTSGISFVGITTVPPFFSAGHGYQRTFVYGAKWPDNDPTPPTFSEAVKVHEFVGDVGAFPSDPGTRWCIWLKWLSNDGVPSASPSGGVNGDQTTTGQDVRPMNDALTSAAMTPGTSTYSKLVLRADLFAIAPEVMYAQEAEPSSGMASGDVWFKPSTDEFKRYDGASWVAYAAAVPFIVQTEPTVINGVTIPAGVYMDAAFIVNLTAMIARLGAAWIDNAMIANLSAAKLTVGDGTVGGNLKSTVFNGTHGWQLQPDGTAYLRNAVVSGTLYANAADIQGQLVAEQIDSRGLTIKDGSGNVILSAGVPLPVANASAGLQNAQISMAANGQIIGAGGGQVTIGGLGYTGDLNASADLVLITSAGITVTGNTISRTDGGSGWNQQARSKDSYVGGAMVSAVIGGHGIMIGLNTDPDANSSYETIDFAIYPEAGGALQSYESGTVYSLGTWVVGDLVSVTYDGAFVRYYKNGALLRQTAAMPGLQFFLDTSFALSGSPWRNVRFAPFANTNTGRGQNLIDASWWNPGIDPSSRWATNNETNAFTSSTLPDGSNGIVWRATETTGNGSSGGGWNVSGGGGNRFPVSADKTYLFACYIKGTSGTGTAFFGASQDNTICDLNTQTQSWNPYFGVCGHTGDGSWRLHVGWVYPAGMTGLVHGRAGVYDCKTGVKLSDGSSHNWHASATSATTRAYQYYASTGATQEFCWPMVFLCDGSEPSIDDLLSMSMPSARNPITSTNVSTYIADATIGEAKILGTLNANKITAGTITSDRFALSTGQASIGSWGGLSFYTIGSPGAGGGYSGLLIPQPNTFSVDGGGTLAGYVLGSVTLPSSGATITATVSGSVGIETNGNWSGPGAGEHTLIRSIWISVVRKLSPTVIQATTPVQADSDRKELYYLVPNYGHDDDFAACITVGNLAAGEYLLILNGQVWANEGAGVTPLYCLSGGYATFNHSMLVNYV